MMQADQDRDKLVNLGAEKLESHLHYLKRERYGEAHYYKGSFQALKETAQALFEIDSAEFRHLCMDQINESLTPLLSSDYWDCECADMYIHHNSVEYCPDCEAHRDESPDSRQCEVDEGTHFAEVNRRK